MSDAKKEAVKYFKENPGFYRCFQAMRKKWRTYGKCTGKIKLENCSVEEQRSLGGFLCCTFHDAEISFDMMTFKDALAETRYGFLTLEELLGLYFDEELVSNKERKLQEAKAWEQFCESCRIDSFDLIESMQNKKTAGYKTVYKEWKQNPKSASQLVLSIGRAIQRLEQIHEAEEQILLALLATEVSGNPHYFDRGTVEGQLLTFILSCKSGKPFPENASNFAELYSEYGILLDDISNTVAAFGLHLEKNGILHPAFEGFIHEKESFVITGKNLESITRAYGDCSIVFAVENEMVFSHLCHQCRSLPATIVCMSGQPRKAGWRLLELLAAEDIQIYYSGDLDPEGMDIAERIWKHYPKNVRIWRMDEASYELSKSEEVISERRLKMMERLQHPVLLETARKIKTCKKAGYQEAVLKEMVHDIIEKCGKNHR